jgi:hypothetical protein
MIAAFLKPIIRKIAHYACLIPIEAGFVPSINYIEGNIALVERVMGNLKNPS